MSPLSHCHVSRYDLLSLSAYIHHLYGSLVHTLHPLFCFFSLPLLLLLLIGLRDTLTSPPFLRFGSQMKDLSLYMYPSFALHIQHFGMCSFLNGCPPWISGGTICS